MSDVRLLIGIDERNKQANRSLRLRIEAGTKSAVIDINESKEINLNYGDRVICVYGSVRAGLIFRKRHNGVSVDLSAIPKQGGRREIMISNYLLDELLTESRRNSASVRSGRVSGVDLSRMSAISER